MSDGDGVSAVGKARKVFYGYWVMLACFVLHAIGSGEFFYGFSVFYTPILLEFGWSSAVTAGAFSLSRLEGGLEGPVVGWLVDRVGPRKLLVVGVVLSALGFFAMTQVDSVLLLYLVYGGLLSIGYNTGFVHSMASMVAQWFIRRRSFAMSIYALAAGIGGSVIVPLLARSIAALGWRSTAMICGASLLVVGIPLSLIVRDRPEDMGLLPDGMDPSELKSATVGGSSPEGLGLETEFTARQVFETSTFWTLMLGECFRSFLLGSVVIHQIPYLMSIGLPEETAANILGLMITLSIIGRLAFGSLGDYWSKRKLLVIAMFLQAVGIFVFSQATGVLHAYAFVAIYGIAYGGAIPLLYSFRGELFGRRRYATISGAVAPFKMIGNVVGPVFAGYIFDVYGDYRLAFYIFAVLALLSAFTFSLVRPIDNNRSGLP
jgi:MFS family permease